MSVVDEFLQADRLTPEGSLFAPESLQEVRNRLDSIKASWCGCPTGAHADALHDLALTDVPVLLRLIEHLAPQRIEAADELNTLPPRTLVRDDMGEYFDKLTGGWDCLSEDGTGGLLLATAIRLPALVLWTPGDKRWGLSAAEVGAE